MEKKRIRNFKSIHLFLTILMVALILISGCAEKNTSPLQTDNLVEMQNSQNKTQEKPTPGSVQSVNFSKLIEFLPSAPPDWTAKEPQGFMYAAENGSWSVANKKFVRGDLATASVGIMDSAYYEVGWFLVWKGIYKYESAEGYTKTTTINGYPALELYSKSDNEYTLYVMVKERFMVYINVRDADKDTLEEIANEINYAAIAVLK
ncbi:MAG: hypothetical protein Q7J35_07160 [Candidatus Methanoperedens sp.]|nr:hypothetical protein [Candidatus Methanoperedens sp.]